VVLCISRQGKVLYLPSFLENIYRFIYVVRSLRLLDYRFTINDSYILEKKQKKKEKKKKFKKNKKKEKKGKKFKKKIKKKKKKKRKKKIKKNKKL